MFYSNNETLSFEDVKSHLLSKEKYDKQYPPSSSGQAEGLTIRGRSLENDVAVTK